MAGKKKDQRKKKKSGAFTLTYATMFNPPEELHSNYERALKKVKANLGAQHGMIINGKEVRSAQKFEDRSPINTDWVLGVFQKGGVPHAQRAISAARKAFPGWASTPWQDRVKVLRKAAKQIDKRIYEIAAVLSLEVSGNMVGSAPISSPMFTGSQMARSGGMGM